VVVAAAQEERFTRKKHDPDFPEQAVQFCLTTAGLTSSDLDYVAFYEKPLRKFDRLMETYLSYAPDGLRSFNQALPLWLKNKLYLTRTLNAALSGYKHRYVFPEHHESHAASAFFPSPYREAAVLTLDGVGEWATGTYGFGRDNQLTLLAEARFPHSLGLLYSAFTYFTGFKVNSGEYKLMGLAPYGSPRFAARILDRLIDLKDDGSFQLNLDYFEYCQGLRMTSRRMDNLLEGPPRRPECELTQREMDIAASIQVVTEEILLRTARHVARETGMRHLVMAGGVALNCVANARLRADRVFDDVWVQPAAGDAGGALGAALFVWYQLLRNSRQPSRNSQKASLLGPAFGNDEIAATLSRLKAPSEYFESEAELLDRVASEIESGKVVGWFSGRMEFGPRALGARSILGDARSPRMQSVMNLKIKFRESFRPFAPSVLKEEAHEWFDVPPGYEDPYMLFVAGVLPSRQLSERTENASLHGIHRLLNSVRSQIPAVTHVDYSARVQTVDERQGRYYRLLCQFRKRTGCPVIVNTSFNVRGEPIVCTPDDAYRCFMATDMDVLVLENHVLTKTDQPPVNPGDVDNYRREFELD
jgi:carbamoyltransferase